MKKTLLKSNVKHAMLCFIFIAFNVSLIHAQTSTMAEHYTSKTYDCAIFPDKYPTELNGTRFTPAHTDIDSATFTMAVKLKDVKCSSKEDRDAVVNNLAKYKMQVFGYTTAEGYPILFFNCFRNDREKDKELANTWLNEMVLVQDGGNYFWTVKYDVIKHRFFDFRTNGNG